MIPREIPFLRGYETAVIHNPGRKEHGDCLELFKLDDHCHAILLADVAGKGQGKKEAEEMLHSFLPSNPLTLAQPVAAMAELNDSLRRSVPRGMFVTGFYLVLDLMRGRITAVNCGHTPMIWYRSRTRSIDRIGDESLPLGIAEHDPFVSKNTGARIDMDLHDLVFLYTDGATESEGPQGEEYGVERLEREIHKGGGKGSTLLVEQVERSLRSFAGGQSLQEEYTLVALRRVQEFGRDVIP
jgi:sigma-B regulation protein RsbU (phosphoserine phosphatase)